MLRMVRAPFYCKVYQNWAGYSRNTGNSEQLKQWDAKETEHYNWLHLKINIPDKGLISLDNIAYRQTVQLVIWKLIML